MNTFTLVFQHNYLPAVKITIDVESDLALPQVTEDATAVIDAADDLIVGAELDMRDYTLIKIECRGYTVAKFVGVPTHVDSSQWDDRDNG